MPNQVAFAATKPGKIASSSIKSSSISYYSMSIKWGKASNAKKYKVAFRHNSRYNWRYKTVSTNSAKLENLLPNTKYTIKIQSLNGTKKSDWSNAKTFTTKKSPYTKRYIPKSKSYKHAIGIVEGGWVAVKTSTHITEDYKYDGSYKKFGYRCYGTTFTSINDKSLLNKLNCSIWAVQHHTAYKKNSETKYNTVKCNVYSCIHDHIYGGDTFSRPEKDSTTIVYSLA